MILSNLLQACLMAVCAGVILGLALIVLALLTYFVAAFISILIQTFKDVRAKQKVAKMIFALKNIEKAVEQAKQNKE